MAHTNRDQSSSKVIKSQAGPTKTNPLEIPESCECVDITNSDSSGNGQRSSEVASTSGGTSQQEHCNKQKGNEVPSDADSAAGDKQDGGLEWPLPSEVLLPIRDPTEASKRLGMAAGVVVTVIGTYVTLGFVATFITPPILSEGDGVESCLNPLLCHISAALGWLCCGLSACCFLSVPVGIFVYFKKLSHMPTRGRLPVWQFSLSALGFSLAFVDLAYFFLEEWTGGLYPVYDYMDSLARSPLRMLLAVAPGCLTAALTIIPVTSLLLRFVVIYLGRPRLCPPGWVSFWEVHTIRRFANKVPYIYLAVGIIPGVLLFCIFSTTDYLIRTVPVIEESSAWPIHLKIPVIVKWYRNVLLAVDLIAVGCLFIIRRALSLNDLDQTKVLITSSLLLALGHFYYWYLIDYLMVSLWPKIGLLVIVMLQAVALGYYYYSVVQVMRKKQETDTGTRIALVRSGGVQAMPHTDGSESCDEPLAAQQPLSAKPFGEGREEV